MVTFSDLSKVLQKCQSSGARPKQHAPTCTAHLLLLAALILLLIFIIIIIIFLCPKTAFLEVWTLLKMRENWWTCQKWWKNSYSMGQLNICHTATSRWRYKKLTGSLALHWFAWNFHAKLCNCLGGVWSSRFSTFFEFARKKNSSLR